MGMEVRGFPLVSLAGAIQLVFRDRVSNLPWNSPISLTKSGSRQAAGVYFSHHLLRMRVVSIAPSLDFSCGF